MIVKHKPQLLFAPWGGPFTGDLPTAFGIVNPRVG